MNKCVQRAASIQRNVSNNTKIFDGEMQRVKPKRNKAAYTDTHKPNKQEETTHGCV